MDSLSGATGYGDLADRLRRAVRDGTLKPGERLPSQRRLAYRLGLAVGTVTRAYALLEREGLLDSYVGRGTFVAVQTGGFSRNFAAPRPGDDINLALDLPLEHLNPPINDILAELAAEPGADAFLQYAPTELDRRFAETGVLWNQEYGLTAPAETVLPVLGGQHGQFTALATTCRPGDVVITEALTYPGFLGSARLLGVKLEAAAMDAQGIIPQAVEEICRRQAPRALYVTPSLQNPTTGQLGPKRREALAEIARRYDMAIIEDDLKPRYVVPAPPPIAALAPERTFFISGVSKIIGGGCRAAFLTVPETERAAADHNRWAAIWRVPALSFEIACRLIRSGTAYRVALAKEDEAARRRSLVEQRLGEFDVRTARGSTYAWLTLPRGWTNATALTALKEKGVAVSAADAFWAGQTPPPNALRLCLGAQPDAATLDEALRRVAEVLEAMPHTVRL